MNTSDKILSGLLFTVLIIVCCLAILAELGLLSVTPVSDLFAPAASHAVKAAIVGTVAFILLILCVRLFLATLFFKKKGVSKALISNNPLGNAYISLEAINVMAKRFCLTFKFVADCKTDVTISQNGVIVNLKIVPYADSVLPDNIDSLQKSLKEAVELQAGLIVTEIPVLIMPQTTKKNVDTFN